MEPLVKKCKMNSEDVFACKEEEACSKTYKSKRSLKRHVNCKHHIYSQRPPFSSFMSTSSSTPQPSALLEPAMDESTSSTAAPKPTQPVARVGIDIVDHDSGSWHQYHQMKEEMLDDDEYPTTASHEELTEILELPCTVDNEQQMERITNMIIEFFTYWTDNKFETRNIDTIAQLLIKHTRTVKQNDGNYLAAVMSPFDMLHQTDRLDLEMMYKIISAFIINVKQQDEHNIFGWNCLVIVFTMAHELLMKFPHLYIDLVDMLCEVFNLAGNDFVELGGWKDFINYSGTIFGIVVI